MNTHVGKSTGKIKGTDNSQETIEHERDLPKPIKFFGPFFFDQNYSIWRCWRIGCSVSSNKKNNNSYFSKMNSTTLALICPWLPEHQLPEAMDRPPGSPRQSTSSLASKKP
ncbi:hypothetical protein J6590_056530 [Homalodisca vitripennis]|nr:hypothetical protein J6590_056530 [Homalodisca vitripennis]